MSGILMIIYFMTIGFGSSSTCPYTRVICLDNEHFQLCTNKLNITILLAFPMKCPDGTKCDDRFCFPCSVLNAEDTTTSTTTTTTTTQATITTPSCDELGKYPAPQCNQYYECTAFLFWHHLNLQTCPIGQAFNSQTLECVPSNEIGCLA